MLFGNSTSSSILLLKIWFLQRFFSKITSLLFTILKNTNKNIFSTNFSEVTMFVDIKVMQKLDLGPFWSKITISHRLCFDKYYFSTISFKIMFSSLILQWFNSEIQFLHPYYFERYVFSTIFFKNYVFSSSFLWKRRFYLKITNSSLLLRSFYL